MFYRFKYHRKLMQITQGYEPPAEIMNMMISLGQANNWSPKWTAVATATMLRRRFRKMCWSMARQ